MRASAASASGSVSKKQESAAPPPPKDKLDLTSTQYVYHLHANRRCRSSYPRSFSPSNEWQDKVIDMLGAGRTTEPAYSIIENDKPSLRVATRSGEGRERQRRRLGNEDYAYDDINPGLPSPTSTSASPNSAGSGSREEEVAREGEEEEKQLAQAVGELSLNEDEEVRYHGQASGLYLLGGQERVDQRNEGGIWCVVLSPSELH
jgi:hypothetical protein